MSTPQPTIVVLPSGLTCLRCESRPALDDRLWCANCVPIVDALPVEPVDTDLEACIARHPAGKQLRARSCAEDNHPARLLGIAQVAIEVALRTNDLAEVRAQLEVALARIKPTEAPA